MFNLNIPKAEDRRVYTVNEVIAHFNTSRETLRKWRNAGLLKTTEFQVPYVTTTFKKGTRTQIGFLGRHLNEFANTFLSTFKR